MSVYTPVTFVNGSTTQPLSANQFNNHMEAGIQSVHTEIDGKLNNSAGTIIYWPSTTSPPSSSYWLECNGASVSRATYSTIFNLFKCAFSNKATPTWRTWETYNPGPQTYTDTSAWVCDTPHGLSTSTATPIYIYSLNGSIGNSQANNCGTVYAAPVNGKNNNVTVFDAAHAFILCDTQAHAQSYVNAWLYGNDNIPGGLGNCSATGTIAWYDNVNNFPLPDLRGIAIRGWDHGRGLDTNRVICTYQEQDTGPHVHSVTDDHSNGSDSMYQDNSASVSGGYATTTTSTTSTDPATNGHGKNYAMVPYIRYA